MARILVVDDSLYMRTMLRHILTDAGHEVVGEAADAQKAIDMARQLLPDLITLDVILPDNTGIEVLKQIKKERPDSKIVLVSAVGQDMIIDEAKSSGAEDYIIKPFSQDKVVSTVTKVISNKTTVE